MFKLLVESAIDLQTIFIINIFSCTWYLAYISGSVEEEDTPPLIKMINNTLSSNSAWEAFKRTHDSKTPLVELNI